MYPDNNPKSGAARFKPTFHAIPTVGLIEEGAAMLDGKGKYTLMNWRETDVAASVYYDAILRHLFAWYDSKEERAPDSQAHHLGHVKACCSILLDAMANGSMVDDRPKIASKFVDLCKEYEAAKAA